MPARPRRKGSLILTFVTAWVFVCLLTSASALRADESMTALLIIDVQEFYYPGGALPLADPGKASSNIKRLLAKWRQENRPIIHIGHNAAIGAAFHADVVPAAGETVIYKDEVNAFIGTDLFSRLKENEIERLVICGMQTHMCVEAAVRAAHDMGFECLLVGDACATRDLEYEGRTIAAQDVHDSTLETLDRAYARVVDTETVLKEY